MISKNMVQCRLVQEAEGRRILLMTWLPQNQAVEGKKLRLEDTGDIFTVKKKYTMMDAKEVQENSQDYKRTRKFSDI